jgi:hypothetical protein
MPIKDWNRRMLYSQVGRGTFVKAQKPKALFPPTPFGRIDTLKLLTRMDQGRLQIPRGAYNFASAIPTPVLIPVADFKLS